MNTFKSYLNRPFWQHLLFWVAILVSYIIVNREHYTSYPEVTLTHLVKVGLQMIAAYACLLFIIPRYLAKRNKLEVIGILFLLLWCIHFINTSLKMGYFEPTYPVTYTQSKCACLHLGFWQRIFDLKTLFFTLPVTYLQPAVLLIALQYFQNQQRILQLKEQKKTAELSLLKNQLNPHFLFNTLNNLYAMAIQKSDKTPEVIGMLSEILDYTLYGCNEKMVSIDKEIQLIDNYLALEKVRYGKRVTIQFEKVINEPVEIAPLLLLTFIENAFKHGVREEIGIAKVDLFLKTANKEIDFIIKNSISAAREQNNHSDQPIGLKNVQQQLDLLYPDLHHLEIQKTNEYFTVNLKLKTL